MSILFLKVKRIVKIEKEKKPKKNKKKMFLKYSSVIGTTHIPRRDGCAVLSPRASRLLHMYKNLFQKNPLEMCLSPGPSLFTFKI